MPLILKDKDLKWNVVREGCKRKVITTENVMVVVYNIEPGPGLPPHKHENVEQIAHIIHGKAKFNVNGEDVIAEAGDFLVFKPGTVHGGQIIGDEMAVTIDIFVPPLKDYLSEAKKA